MMRAFVGLVLVIVAVSAVELTLRDIEGSPAALQGYFDTLKEIYYKLKELGGGVNQNALIFIPEV